MNGWLVSLGPAARCRDAVAQLREQGMDEVDAPSGGCGVVLVGQDCPALSRLLEAARAGGGRVLVVVVPGGPDPDPWGLLAAGAGDVLWWGPPWDPAPIRARLSRWAAVEELLDSPTVSEMAAGDAPAWRSVLREVVEIARFTRSSMLITGETGTGKEVVARLVHRLDARTDIGRLELVDCTTVVPSLSGSEFFGHTKGAFTGASSSRVGAFSRADGGTLFLDEVGELPMPLQGELLRVVQEGMYKPVGGDTWRRTSFRLLAATNRDLVAEVSGGRFRGDLYFRLAGTMVHLPPLRDRPEDIVPLFRRFFAEASGARDGPSVTPAVEDLLLRRGYPGNVRDLRQLAGRAAARHVGQGPVTPGDIAGVDRVVGPPVPPGARHDAAAGDGPTGPPSDGVPVPAPTEVPLLEVVVREMLGRGVGLKEMKAAVADVATRVALGEGGGPTAAARLLGVSRRAVDYRKAGGKESGAVPEASSVASS